MKPVSQHMHTVLKSLQSVFGRPAYGVLALLVALALVVIMILLPNHELVRYVVSTDIFTPSQKIKILLSLLGGFKTNLTVSGQVTLTIVALLAGVNMALLVYHIKQKATLELSAGTSAMGVVIGLLGIGCSACGSVILSTLFGITAAGALISFLPLKGLEFSLLSIAVLLVSILYVAHRLQNGKSCKLPTRHGQRLKK